MGLFLILVSGIAWTVVYIESVRVGLRDRTYAMPVLALALNFAWETIYAVHGLSRLGSLQAWVNLVWALCDVAIIGTFVRFGRREFPRSVPRWAFWAGALGLLAVTLAVEGMFVVEFGWRKGSVYSAFLQNLLMSGLYLAMLVSRGGLRGQSVTIAAAKWLGTVAPTVLFGWMRHLDFALVIGALCCVVDLAYLSAVVALSRRRRSSPVAGSAIT